MNGIIFHGNFANLGCRAEFLFEPEVTEVPTQAIAVFDTGEKAYAEIIRDSTSGLRVHIGEYHCNKGSKILDSSWQLLYNAKIDTWQIIKNLVSIF